MSYNMCNMACDLNESSFVVDLVASNALYAIIFLFKAFSLRLLHVLSGVGANGQTLREGKAINQKTRRRHAISGTQAQRPSTPLEL